MTLRRGLHLSLLISVISLAGIFFHTANVETLGSLPGQVNPFFILLCVVGVPIADWLLAGLRIYIFTRIFARQISYAACVRNSAVGAFMSAATPSQTGGSVAQIYVLVKEGAGVAQAMSVLFMAFLSTLVFYLSVSVTMLVLAAKAGIPGVETSIPFLISTALFGALTIIGFATVTFPERVRLWLRRATVWLEARRLPTRMARKVDEVLDECSELLRMTARKHRRRFGVAVLLSLLMFGNKFLAGYLAARAIGLNPPFVDVMVVQVFINVLIYFVPTPGGSGVAEVSTAVLMSRLVPEQMLGPFTVLWRVATLYLSVMFGGLLLARYLRRDSAARTGSPARRV